MSSSSTVVVGVAPRITRALPVYSISKRGRSFQWVVWMSEAETWRRDLTYEDSLLSARAPASSGSATSREAAIAAALLVAPTAAPVACVYAYDAKRMVREREVLVAIARALVPVIERNRPLLTMCRESIRLPQCFRSDVSVADVSVSFPWIRHDIVDLFARQHGHTPKWERKWETRHVVLARLALLSDCPLADSSASAAATCSCPHLDVAVGFALRILAGREDEVLLSTSTEAAKEKKDIVGDLVRALLDAALRRGK